jgi:hypothetical protein
MTLEARIYQALAPVLANEVYPLQAPPETARPYCIYTSVSNTATYTLAKAGNLDRRLVQLDVYSNATASYDAHVALAKSVRFALETIGGQLNGQGGELEADTQLYRTRLDLYFWDRPA